MNVNINYDYIGSTGNYPIIDYIDSKIDIIDIKIDSNFSNIYSNISNIYSNITDINSNANKLKNETYHINSNNPLCLINNKIYSGIPHTYIINSNINGEIRFNTYLSFSATDDPINNYAVKIDTFGKLYVYHKYNIIQGLFTAGWYDVEGEIFALKNAGVIVDSTVGGLTVFQGIAQEQITLLQALTGVLGFQVQNLQEQVEMLGFVSGNEMFLLQGAQNFETALPIFENFVSAMTQKYTNSLTVAAGVVGYGFVIPYILSSSTDYFNRLYYNSLVSNFSNAYLPSLTEEQRRILYSCNDDGLQSNISNYYNNTCNLGISQGFINCNVITQQFVPSFNTNQIKINNTNISNIFIGSNLLSNINLNQGFINTNITNQQLIPTLKSNKILLGNITTPNSAYQMEMTGDLNLNMIYLNSTSLTSLLNQKQNNMTATQPIFITTANIGLNYDASLTKVGNNLSVVKTATTPIVITGNDWSLNYDSSLTKISGNLSVVKTASLPLVITGNNWTLNYDSTLTLSGNNLSVATASASKWTQSGNNIYNNNIGNVGVGVNSPTEKLDVNGNIYARNNLYIGNSTSIISSYTNATINNISGTTDKYLTYTTSGTLVLNDLLTCDIFMIGGGGGGGYNHGGGGGAGAYYRGSQTLSAGSYSITVGAGGTQDNSGGNTIISLGATNILIVNGGGKGGSFNTPYTGTNGGCGGGGTGWNNNAATNTTWAGGSAINTGTNGSGFGGGTGINNYNGNSLNGGGGGGIGGIGQNAPSGTTGTGAAGGNALNIDITGVNVVYGGGGGGGVWGDGTKTITGGLGGGVGSTYVGGQGGKTTAQAGGNGVANTGSGGGGGGPAFGVGGNGSAGIIIIRFTETGKLGIGTKTPSQKLHIEDGSVFIGDSSVGDGQQIDNGYKLIFDTSYTTNGNNKCNKILLHNNQSGIGYYAGFGVEYSGLVYSTWTGARHKFYTETTTTSGGFQVLDLLKDQFNFFGNNNGGSGGYVRNSSAGSSAYTYFALYNDLNLFAGMLVNSSTRTAEGGANNMTIRNDGGDLILSAKNSTPQILLQESTDRIYMNGLVNIRQASGGGSYAVPNSYMQDGSLTIGSINLNYGWGSSWSTNTAGLMLECYDSTEIAVHDAGNRVTSLIAYQGGGSYNHIHIGRNMGAGWGAAWVVNFPGAQIALASEWYIYRGTTPTGVINSLIFLHSTDTITSRWWLNGTQNGTSADISDERIKKEINDIDNPLEKLLLIKPKEYYLCSDKDYNKKYGIIAQDINKEESLKHLIFTDKEYIANLLTNAKFIKEKIGEEEPILEHPEEKYIKSEDNPTPYQRPKPKEIFKYTITTDKNLSGLINIDDELKMVLDNDNIDNIEIVIDDTPYNNRYKKRFVKVKQIINDYSFEIYEDIELTDTEKDNLFIYGKKVDDFLKLDYESLYCLNIKATQELYNIIQQQQDAINKLSAEIQEIKINFLNR